MPGEELQDALNAAGALSARGLSATLTHLGENAADIASADEVVGEYLMALDACEAANLDAEISVKLTHMGLDVDVEGTESRVTRIAERSKEMDRWLWIDMEDSTYVDATLALYKKTQSRLGNVGVCLQAYLRPTPVDIADLRPLRPGIRLVKGAYKEAASVALLRKKDIDGAFHGLAVQLAHLAAEGEVRAATATHDVGLLARLQEVAGAASLPKDAYEVQMLYGIRTADQERIAAEGYAMRTLIAYGPAWYPWYIRRLAERPANVWFVARNLLSRRRPRQSAPATDGVADDLGH